MALHDHQPTHVEITRNGDVYTGTYMVGDDVITVEYKGRTKTTRLGNSPAASVAILLLSELVKDSQVH